MSSYIKAGSEPNNRIPGSVNPNKGRGRDLLTNEVKVQLLMACRCSSLLFPTTRLFPPRQRGRRRVYCVRRPFIECSCSIQPFKSIVRVGYSSIVRVFYSSSAGVPFSRSSPLFVRRRVYCSSLLLFASRLLFAPSSHRVSPIVRDKANYRK